MCCKKPIKTWDNNVENTIIIKPVKAKTNSDYCFGFLDKSIRLWVLIMPKISGYVKAFKVKGDKNKNNKLMSFLLDDEKLSE